MKITKVPPVPVEKKYSIKLTESEFNLIASVLHLVTGTDAYAIWGKMDDESPDYWEWEVTSNETGLHVTKRVAK